MQAFGKNTIRASPLQWLLAYLVSLVCIVALDLLWLGVIATSMYEHYLSPWLREDVLWWVVLFFYLVYILGILLFAVRPAASRGSHTMAMLNGALFGFFAYATYDLTNLATIAGWPIEIAVIDMVWGSCLTCLTSLTGYSVLKGLKHGRNS